MSDRSDKLDDNPFLREVYTMNFLALTSDVGENPGVTAMRRRRFDFSQKRDDDQKKDAAGSDAGPATPGLIGCGGTLRGF